MKTVMLMCVLATLFFSSLIQAQDRDFDIESPRARRHSSLLSKPYDENHRMRAQGSNFFAATSSKQSFAGASDTAWVRHYTEGRNPSYDLAQALAVDYDGNVYVIGKSSGVALGVDYVLIKYNSSGGKVWEARYNGPGNKDDWPGGLCLDEAGNVYVTGASLGVDTSTDYATIKYDAAGREQWIARYNGPGNSFDEAAAVAVDASGNVFVTGRSVGQGTVEDYATIKYNPAGTEQWVARYNGPDNSYDVAVALAVDAAGEVSVTGWSDGPSGSFYATVKYSSAGIEQWAARYNSPANGNDAATDIAVDAVNNVYVTGASVGTNSSFDYATIKYGPGGVVQWVARYNAPANDSDYANALAVDAEGNVYVTGNSDNTSGNSDYATVKYNSAGAQQWVARYNGPANSSELAAAIGIDATGAVFVTGESWGESTNWDYATVKYNSAGVEQWAVRYDAARGTDGAMALAVDVAGNVCVTGRNLSALRSCDFVTIKYETTGKAQWLVAHDGPNTRTDDEAEALALDAEGNVYVTGSSRGVNADFDYLTIKYNREGVMQWANRYDPGNNLDIPVALAVDGVGNVYVTGRSRISSSNTSDFATIKYNRSGAQEWVARYNGPANDSDVPAGIALDAQGHIYVAGSSRGLGSDYDFVAIKYDARGAALWVARYNAPADSVDIATGLALDFAGNVYLTGRSVGSSSGFDYASVKYNNAGTQQWAERYNGPANARDVAIGIAVDSAGNVWVTGESDGVGTRSDYATIKYSAAGAQQVAARYNGPANNTDFPADLALDAAGNVYVTGSSIGGTGRSASFDFATIKYDNAGAQQWVARYNGAGDTWDDALALAVDDAGNVYVTGEHGFTKVVSQAVAYGIPDFATIKYNPAGVEQWIALYNGPSNDVDTPVGIGVDHAGNVYVAGYSFAWSSDAGWSAFTTIKYASDMVAVHEEEHAAPAGFHLSQNYPNPFNPATTIAYALPRAEHVTLRVFDLLGREVTTLVNERLPAGRYHAVWEAKGMESGVYFYRLQAGSFVQTKRLAFLQ